MNELMKQNKNNQEDKSIENLSNKYWLGVVVDANDPLYQGRCKVRVFEKFDNLADIDLPWAFPNYSSIFAGGVSSGNGSFSYPKEGTLVRVKFESGDIYAPEYEVVQNINKKMQDEIKESYINSQVLVYDDSEDMKIIYTQKTGLMIWNKKSYINISNDGDIFITHSGNTSESVYVDGNIAHKANTHIMSSAPTIYLKTPDCRLGKDAAHPAVKGDELVTLLMKLATSIDLKVPTTPGLNVGAVLNSDILSTQVYVAD